MVNMNMVIPKMVKVEVDIMHPKLLVRGQGALGWVRASRQLLQEVGGGGGAQRGLEM